MKKLVLVLLALAIATGSVFAAGVSAKSNLSTGWVQNPSKNVEARRVDSSIYNIGGTAFVKDGLYFELGNQFIIKQYSHKGLNGPFEGKKFKESQPVLFFPDLVALYKKDNWAASFNFTIISGGGKVNYKDGTALTSAALMALGSPAHKVKVNSVVYGQELTFAFKPKDWISVAAGIRFAESTQKMDLTVESFGIKDEGYKASGFGVGGVFGVHAKPVENLDLSFQYKTRLPINMFVTDVDDSIAALGISIEDYESDIPAEILFGAGYRISRPLYVSMGFGYFLGKRAYQHSALSNLRNGGGDDWENSWNIQAGIEWDINDKFTLMGGYNFGQSAANDTTNSFFSPVLANHNIMLGADWKISDQFTAAFGAMGLISADKNYTTKMGTFKMETGTYIMSVGLTYKPL